MEQEIEMKIMLAPSNIIVLKDWLAKKQNITEYHILVLKNNYYDTEDHFFAKHKMGLRVRKQQDNFELTLKTAGEIRGGLHIRPEYNILLPNDYPDLKRLDFTYNLHFSYLQHQLKFMFSTDFQREVWLYQPDNNTQVEVALDIGEIKNQFGIEPICELELELKKGELSQLFSFVLDLPLENGLWLSNVSKAQRGYQTGDTQATAIKIDTLLKEDINVFNSAKELYQFEQQLVEILINVGNDKRLEDLFKLVKQRQGIEEPIDVMSYIKSKAYIEYHLNQLL